MADTGTSQCQVETSPPRRPEIAESALSAAATPKVRRAFASWIGTDTVSGLTVALVAVPQCVGFATIAGLPATHGIYAAVVMGLVSAAMSESPKLVVGPAITASTMLLAVLRTVEPGSPERWPAIAVTVAMIVGLLTVLAAILDVGRAVRFVSRSVVIGLIAGSAMLTIGAQLAPAMGVASGREPVLAGILWHAVQHAGGAHGGAFALAAGTCLLTLAGTRLGPRFPAAFVALLASGVAAWWLAGSAGELRSIGDIEWSWSWPRPAFYGGTFPTDLFGGAAAICIVGVIQNLSIAKGLALRDDRPVNGKRELWSLGLANVASGLAGGLPGSGSFARSALNDLSGARTRLANVVAAIATAVIAIVGAPLARYVTLPAIAGLLVATALSMIDWREIGSILRDRQDRPVLLTTVIGALFLPIHWAILFGLAVSILLLLRRVSKLYMYEMVQGDEGRFLEREPDERTGESEITMLQIEGPLFFAHAELLSKRLAQVFGRRPRVTVLRMRRTQQIDFSVVAALDRAFAGYLRGGGHVVICGLSPEMRRSLLAGPLGKTIGGDFLLETTREVFGSAHLAIGLAQHIVDVEQQGGRPRVRRESSAPLDAGASYD